MYVPNSVRTTSQHGSEHQKCCPLSHTCMENKQRRTVLREPLGDTLSLPGMALKATRYIYPAQATVVAMKKTTHTKCRLGFEGPGTQLMSGSKPV